MGDERRVADDELRWQIRARLSEGRLTTADGVSSSHRGTGRPCIVCLRAIEVTHVERQVQGSGVFLYAHEACYKLWREESSTRKSDRALHVLAGRILEIGDGYILLGFSSAPIRLTDALADGFRPGQRVKIAATLSEGEFIAQSIEPA